MRLSKKTYITSQILFLLLNLILIPTISGMAPEIDRLLNKMEEAYSNVEDYQTGLRVTSYKEDGSVQTQRALYTFKKPNRIRLDFESPHPGLILVYPVDNGKVLVQPSGWKRFFRFKSNPDSAFLKVSPGQRIDQTDMGLLIRNISLSLTEHRRSDAILREDDGLVHIEVMAYNHFRHDVVTFYQFVIDKGYWLPIAVKESTPEGRLERLVIFEGLKTNTGITDSFFKLDGG